MTKAVVHKRLMDQTASECFIAMVYPRYVISGPSPGLPRLLASELGRLLGVH